MLVIRLARKGAKKNPFYNIVATDSRKRRDSGYLERLGYFNPRATEDETYIEINQERMEYWLGQGAKLSDRVNTLTKRVDKPRIKKKRKKKAAPVEDAQSLRDAAIDKAAEKAVETEQAEEATPAAESVEAATDAVPEEVIEDSVPSEEATAEESTDETPQAAAAAEETESEEGSDTQEPSVDAESQAEEKAEGENEPT